MPFSQPWFEVDFGSAYAGIGTTGYRLYKNDGTDSVARTTSGVVDLGNGGYGVPTVNVPDDAAGIEWDTGGGSPVYAREDIEPFRTRLLMRSLALGRMKQNQATFRWEIYDPEGTLIAEFNTTDRDGNPANYMIYERVKV